MVVSQHGDALGLGISCCHFVLCGVYSYIANNKFDQLNEEALKEVEAIAHEKGCTEMKGTSIKGNCSHFMSSMLLSCILLAQIWCRAAGNQLACNHHVHDFLVSLVHYQSGRLNRTNVPVISIRQAVGSVVSKMVWRLRVTICRQHRSGYFRDGV